MAESQAIPQRPPARYVYFDGLRGLAALMVALCHYVSAFQLAMLNGNAGLSHFTGDYLWSKTGFVIFYSPDYGVAIFFILSGFVLASSMEGNRASWIALSLRRWVRLILPVLAVTVLVWIILQFEAYSGVQEAARQTKSAWFAAIDPSKLVDIPLWKIILNGLFSIFVPHPSGSLPLRLNAVLWTMPIELDGSLVLFAAYCLRARIGFLANNRLVWFSLALVAAILTFQTKFYGFGLGVVIFEAKSLIEFQSAHC